MIAGASAGASASTWFFAVARRHVANRCHRRAAAKARQRDMAKVISGGCVQTAWRQSMTLVKRFLGGQNRLCVANSDQDTSSTVQYL